MIQHAAIAPFLLPALTACLLLALDGRLRWQRVVSVASALVQCAVVFRLAMAVRDGDVLVYALGDWPVHLGIVFVLDRLAALMLCMTAAVALPALLHACRGADARGRHFHALFHFQWLGLSGAFLTGDLFNLFVCFELMLIASYALLQHGGGATRLRNGLQYVTLNLVASALFLVAVSLIYRAAGTLNMADLAVRLAAAPSADTPWITAGALLLAVVFLLKGAAAPLYLWLPGTYGAAAAPVAALFAVLTKVGAYAVLRVGGVVFTAVDAGAIVFEVAFVTAVATVVIAALGALAATTLTRLAAWLGLGSSAGMLLAVGFGTSASVAGGLFYALPSTLGVAGLLLLADTIRTARGAGGDTLVRAPRMRGHAVIGAVYVALAVTVAGLPPLAGFLGKSLILAATPGSIAVWGALLAASMLNLVALVRAGSRLFWSVDDVLAGGTARASRPVASAMLVLAVVVTTLAAGKLERFATGAAEAVVVPAPYIESVLGPGRVEWTIRIDPASGAGADLPPTERAP